MESVFYLYLIEVLGAINGVVAVSGFLALILTSFLFIVYIATKLNGDEDEIKTIGRYCKLAVYTNIFLLIVAIITPSKQIVDLMLRTCIGC